MRALETSKATEPQVSPEELLALKTEMGGWGEVWQELGLIGPPEDKAVGPPEDVPAGPPEDVPDAPVDVPADTPVDAPSDSPANGRGGRP